MNHDRKCQIVAAYVVDNMDHNDLLDYATDAMYENLKYGDSGALDEYIEFYGLTESKLEELGA